MTSNLRTVALAVAVVFAATLLGLAQPAGATGTFTQSADGSVCGEVTLDGTVGQYDGDYLIHWFVEENQGINGILPLPGPHVVEFAEDLGDGEVSVVFFATSPESAENLSPEEVAVDTDCAPPVEPTIPDAPDSPDGPVDTPVVVTGQAPAATPVAGQPQLTG